MSGEKEKWIDLKNSNELTVILIICAIVLFKLFIWDQFIINSTADAALKNDKGESGITAVVTKKEQITIRKYKEGFIVYAVAKGAFGWKVTDEIEIDPDDYLEKEVVEHPLRLLKGRNIHLTLLFDKEHDFERVSGLQADGNMEAFDAIGNNGSYLYYHYYGEPGHFSAYEVELRGSGEKVRLNSFG